MEAGDPLTSSSIHATVHLGAHADAHSHYSKDVKTIDQYDLHHCIGLCQFIRPKVLRGELITKSLLKEEIRAERVLFATILPLNIT